MNATHTRSEILALLRADHTVTRPPRRQQMQGVNALQHAHIRDAAGNLVGRAHESTLRAMERDHEVVRLRRDGGMEWVLR